MKLKPTKLLSLLFFALASSMCWAHEIVEAPKRKSVDEVINDSLAKVADIAEAIVFFKIPGSEVPLVLALLVITAIVTTVFCKFINITGIKTAINTIRGKYSKSDDPGEITHFQALTAALSATVGLGNIAGVAIAISIGGAGATFWMILCGLFGMTTKFCECTLGVRYREFDEDGTVRGGGMYYLQNGLKELGLAGFGKVLAVLFAVACIGGSIGAGNMFQGNQAYTQMVSISGGESSYFADKGWLFGVILSVAVGLVIIGGIKGIAKVTSAIVPFMCGIYMIAAIYIIGSHYTAIPDAIGQILNGAFTGEAAVGGFIGALLQGVKRAAFSNEAGLGSAPIAHSAVKTRKAASEGHVALLEPFIDTVVVCTLTALVIIITGSYVEDTANAGTTQGIEVTSQAFGSVITWFPYILFGAVVLFAFSTMISWSYYGQQAWAYLFGRRKSVDLAYKIIFCGFVVVGCSAGFGNVIRLTDALIFSMVFPNLIGLYFLLPKIKEEIKIYKQHTKEIDAQEK